MSKEDSGQDAFNQALENMNRPAPQEDRHNSNASSGTQPNSGSMGSSSDQRSRSQGSRRNKKHS
jgi:hypothetical protein